MRINEARDRDLFRVSLCEPFCLASAEWCPPECPCTCPYDPWAFRSRTYVLSVVDDVLWHHVRSLLIWAKSKDIKDEGMDDR